MMLAIILLTIGLAATTASIVVLAVTVIRLARRVEPLERAATVGIYQAPIFRQGVI